ncbi:MAG: hypothetical protein LUH00_03935, partial [Lachnospiraceae bacterium]|nr:hypothetical protein [Lachnospiraceae bacterium]
KAETEPQTSATETETETETLPQTGQLFWPIPLLAVGGVLLIVVGRYLTMTDAKDRQRDRKR